MHPSFVHLRLHSEYSIADGIVRIGEAVGAAKADAMPALALTDLSNVFGLVKFYKEARGAGIKPVVGCDVFVTNRCRARSAIPFIAVVPIPCGLSAFVRADHAGLSGKPVSRPSRDPQAMAAHGNGRADRPVRRAFGRSRGDADERQCGAARKSSRRNMRGCSPTVSIWKCNATARRARKRICATRCSWPPNWRCRWSPRIRCSF